MELERGELPATHVRVGRTSTPVRKGVSSSETRAKAAVGPVDLSDVGELRRILGFHIRQAHVAVYRHFIDTFSDLDLTQKQVAVLWLISDNPGLAHIDLGRRLRMDRATTTSVVNRLQVRGFIRRGPAPGSRRRTSLFLTEVGDETLVRARQAIWEHEKWLKGRFTGQEVATLMALLDRIHD